MKKRTYKLITWTIVVVTSICIVTVAGIWMMLERDGLPSSVRERLSLELALLGIEAPPSAINGTLAGELVVERPVLRDEALGGMIIFEARRVIVQLDVGLLLQRQLKVEAIRVQDGVVRVPVEQEFERAPILEMTGIDVNVVPGPREYRIERFRGLVEKVPFEVSGIIEKRRREEVRESQRISIASRLPESLGADARRWVFELKEFAHAVSQSSNPMLEVRLGEADAAGIPRIEADLRFGNCIYNGLGMQRVQLQAHMEPEGRVAVDLHAFLDGDDYLALDVVYDWTRGVISGDGDYRGYPHKIRKALMLPEAAPRFLPEFSGKAPRLRVNLHESKLTPIEDWGVGFRLEAEGTRIVDADLSDVLLEGEWGNGLLAVTRVKATVDEPYAEISGDATYVPDTGEVVADVELVGNPRSVVQFTRDARFHRDYLRALQSFDWTGAGRPRGRARIYRSVIDGKASVVLEGSAVMHGAKYNGVTVERATGSFFIDPARQLTVMDNLELVVDGHRSTASLAFDFLPEPPEIRFSGEGTVVIPKLLQMIDPKLPKHYEGWGAQFSDPVEATASGVIHVRGDKRVRFSAQAQSATMTTADAEWKSVSGSVQYDSLSKTIRVRDARAESLQMGEWRVDDLDGEVLVDHGRISFDGKAGRGSSRSVELWDSLVSLRLVDGVASVSTQSSKGRVSDWHFEDLATGIVLETDRLEIEAYAERGRYGDRWTFRSVAGRWDDPGQGAPVAFDYHADTAVSVEAKFGGLAVSGDYHQGIVSGRGTAKSANSTDGLLAGVDVEAVFSQTPGGLTIQSEVPGLRLASDWRMSGVDATVFWSDGLPLAIDFSADSAVSSKRVRTGRISGALQHGGALSVFDLDLSKVSGDDWYATSVSAKGTQTSQATICAIDAKSAEWRGWHADKLQSRAMLADGLLSLQQVSARVAEGTVSGDAFIDLPNQSGQVRFDSRDIGLVALLPGRKGAMEIGGRIDASANLAFKLTEGGLKLNGPGRITLADGNVWKVPILHEFMKALDRFVPGSELTKITQAETDLSFEGGRVHCPNITTNGSIIALDADGWYKWDGEVVDFRVRAKPLPEFFLNRVISKLPFVNKILGESADVLLQRRLKGTLDKPRWENITKLLDILRDSDRSESTEDKKNGKK